MLRTWTAQPVESGAPLKAFVMRLLLAGSYSRARFTCFLQKRHAQVSTHVDALDQAIGILDAVDDPGQRMTFDYGLALATAELAWLGHTLERLSRQPPAEEGKLSLGSPEQLAVLAQMPYPGSG